jgi:transposase
MPPLFQARTNRLRAKSLKTYFCKTVYSRFNYHRGAVNAAIEFGRRQIMAGMRECCCGVDVHKSFIVAVIAEFKGREVVFSKYARFSTFTQGLREFKEWLRDHKCFDVCLESTGKYYVPVYRIVSDENFHVDVVHPKYVKAPRGKKNDKRDAKRIADMYMRDHIAEYSLIPPADILAIRDVTRYRRKTVNSITAEKNRMSNCLTVSCIKLDEVLSDTYGKTGQAIIKQIIKTGGCDFDPKPYIDKRVKASLEAFKMALDGNVTPATLTKMKMIQQRIDFLGKQKAELESAMESLSKDYSRQLEIVDSAPGVDSLSAISIISEIGVDMKQFGSVKRFLSWVGVVPQNNESAGKKKSTRIGKGNTWLKPVIVQCANAAILDKKHPEMRDKYLAIKKRRGHGKALIAISKRLMTAIYYMLLRDEMYNPHIANDTAPKRGRIFLEELIEHYRLKGYTIITNRETA